MSRSTVSNSASPPDASAAGLRYVTDQSDGITRVRRGRGFAYLGPDGGPVGKADRERIEVLAIPPAWTGVWIAPAATAHIQATGRDARGRKQYIYHARWKEVRDSNKFDRLSNFADALPRIRRRVARDIKSGSPQEKVLAAVVRLLDSTSARVGNRQYANDNNSFGLTTLRNRHVTVSGPSVTIDFVGKSGKRHHAELHDARLAKVIRECQDIPGYEVFQYVDDAGDRHRIDSADVNNYLKEISGEDFTAKDFRTWAGSLTAFEQLSRAESATRKTKIARIVNAAVDATAGELGNTRAVCRRSYIHPEILSAYEEGRFPQAPTGTRHQPARTGLNAEERRLRKFLGSHGRRPRSSASNRH